MTPEQKLAEWGPGPWVDEPDRVEFYAHGLPCLIRRAKLGNLCGYVAVPPGHPAHGVGMHDADFRVHGGITYAEGCRGEICHVPREGESDDVHWFGFDAGHAGDLTPSMQKDLRASGMDALANRLAVADEYRDVDYVRAECEDLAKQLAEAAHGL